MSAAAFPMSADSAVIVALEVIVLCIVAIGSVMFGRYLSTTYWTSSTHSSSPTTTTSISTALSPTNCFCVVAEDISVAAVKDIKVGGKDVQSAFTDLCKVEGTKDCKAPPPSKGGTCNPNKVVTSFISIFRGMEDAEIRGKAAEAFADTFLVEREETKGNETVWRRRIAEGVLSGLARDGYWATLSIMHRSASSDSDVSRDITNIHLIQAIVACGDTVNTSEASMLSSAERKDTLRSIHHAGLLQRHILAALKAATGLVTELREAPSSTSTGGKGGGGDKKKMTLQTSDLFSLMELLKISTSSEDVMCIAPLVSLSRALGDCGGEVVQQLLDAFNWTSGPNISQGVGTPDVVIVRALIHWRVKTQEGRTPLAILYLSKIAQAASSTSRPDISLMLLEAAREHDMDLATHVIGGCLYPMTEKEATEQEQEAKLQTVIAMHDYLTVRDAQLYSATRNILTDTANECCTALEKRHGASGNKMLYEARSRGLDRAPRSPSPRAMMRDRTQTSPDENAARRQKHRDSSSGPPPGMTPPEKVENWRSTLPAPSLGWSSTTTTARNSPADTRDWRRSPPQVPEFPQKSTQVEHPSRERFAIALQALARQPAAPANKSGQRGRNYSTASDETLRVYNSMLECGIGPDAETVETVVRILGKHRQVGKAFQIIRDACEKHGMRLGGSIYLALAEAMIRNRSLFKALQLHEEMLQRGVTPHPDFLPVLIRACGAGRYWERCVDLLQAAAAIPASSEHLEMWKQSETAKAENDAQKENRPAGTGDAPRAKTVSPYAFRPLQRASPGTTYIRASDIEDLRRLLTEAGRESLLLPFDRI